MTAIVRRRPDGIRELRPRPIWRIVAGPIPAAILGLSVACAAFLVLLMVALLRSPLVALLALGGGAACVLAASQHGLGRRGAAAERSSPHPRPPRDAA